MATVARLVEEFSEILRVSIADVHHRARRLREAGMLPAEGRGRGAPHVTTRDCATLLVAVLVTETASHCPDAVHRVDLQGKPLRLDTMLVPANTFVGALACIVDHMAVPEPQSAKAIAIRRVGVTRVDEVPHGWLEPAPRSGQFLTRAYYGTRKQLELRNINVAPSGMILPGLETVPAGLTREAYVGGAVLQKLASFLKVHG
jgi:hypothetical protein